LLDLPDFPEGASLGDPLGDPLGAKLGDPVGAKLGDPLGYPLGAKLGDPLGAKLGDPLGDPLGAKLGDPLGASLASCADVATVISSSPKLSSVSPTLIVTEVKGLVVSMIPKKATLPFCREIDRRIKRSQNKNWTETLLCDAQ
jgi:hypothetical protein